MHQQQAPQGQPPNYYAIPPASNTGSGHRPEYTSVYIGNPQFNGFDSKAIRSAFVSKVYAILAVQLVAASAIIAWFTLHQPSKGYLQEHTQLWLFVSAGVILASLLVLFCIESVRRSFPINFIVLSILTLAYALLASTASVRYDSDVVLYAFGTTALSFIVLMLLAKYAPFDMTTCGCTLCVLGLLHLSVTLILTLVLVPSGHGTTASLISAGLGAFLVSLYLVFDLQLIMGGRSNELSPEDYIVAAAILYCDIINLFTYILILFGGARGQ